MIQFWISEIYCPRPRIGEFEITVNYSIGYTDGEVVTLHFTRLLRPYIVCSHHILENQSWDWTQVRKDGNITQMRSKQAGNTFKTAEPEDHGSISALHAYWLLSCSKLTSSPQEVLTGRCQSIYKYPRYQIDSKQSVTQPGQEEKRRIKEERWLSRHHQIQVHNQPKTTDRTLINFAHRVYELMRHDFRNTDRSPPTCNLPPLFLSAWPLSCAADCCTTPRRRGERNGELTEVYRAATVAQLCNDVKLSHRHLL